MSFFGEKLKARMEEKGIAQQDLAFDLRLDPAMISKVLKGKLSPPKSLLEKLPDYEPMGITPVELKAWKMVDEYGSDSVRAAIKEMSIEEKKAILKELLPLLKDLKDLIETELEKRRKK